MPVNQWLKPVHAFSYQKLWKRMKEKWQKNYIINNNKLKIKMAWYSRWITGHFSQDHLPLGKKAVNELHVLGFLSFLLLSRTRVIPSVSVEPTVPRAVLQALGFIRRYLAPFVAMFILALYPNGDGVFLLYSWRATWVTQSMLSFWHRAWIWLTSCS